MRNLSKSSIENTLTELKKYIKSHGCLPEGTSVLYSKSYRLSLKDNRIKDLMSSTPTYRSAMLRKDIQELEQFVKDNNRLPNTSSTDYEYKLYKLMNRLAHSKNPNTKKILTEVRSNIKDVNGEVIDDSVKFSEINDFVNENKRIPSRFISDELVLNKAFNRLLKYRGSSDSIHNAIVGINRKFNNWNDLYQEFLEYVNAEGKLPSLTDNVKLYSFMVDSLESNRSGRRIKVQGVVIGMISKPAPLVTDQSINSINQLESYLTKYNKLPSVEDGKLYYWMKLIELGEIESSSVSKIKSLMDDIKFNISTESIRTIEDLIHKNELIPDELEEIANDFINNESIYYKYKNYYELVPKIKLASTRKILEYSSKLTEFIIKNSRLPKSSDGSHYDILKYLSYNKKTPSSIRLMIEEYCEPLESVK